MLYTPGRDISADGQDEPVNNSNNGKNNGDNTSSKRSKHAADDPPSH